MLAVIQARSSSARLPNKVLKDVAGKPMILRQIERVLLSPSISKLVVATSDCSSDDTLASVLLKENIDVYRGKLDDVLDRYYQASRSHGAQDVVRITGDCPLIDPEVIDLVLQHHSREGLDYTSNTCPPTFPDGLDVEVMKVRALEKAWATAGSRAEREHVTLFIRNNPDLFSIGNVTNTVDLSALRWTVDEPEDLEFVREIYRRLYSEEKKFGMQDIIDVLALHPELSQMNNRFSRNEGLSKSLLQEESGGV